MPLYKPSELKQFLKSINAAPKKTLSQNFLIDGNIVKKIADLADVQSGDTILEIGPGPGVLTEEFLKRNAYVIAVEKDKLFASNLHRLDLKKHLLQVYCEDFLKIDLSAIISQKNVKVIANLPYQITTPILQRLLENLHLFSCIVIMVQEEYAKRMTAKPGTKNYSSLSLFINYYATATYAFPVSHNCFFPKPKVESSIVKLVPHQPPAVSDQNAFFKMMRQAFSQRRKTLKASLKNLYPSEKITQALNHLNLEANTRPETLSLKTFIQLFEMLQKL